MTRWAAGYDHLTNPAVAAWFDAFDLIELNGDDVRDPIEVRKPTFASIVAKASPDIRFKRTHGRRRTDRFRPHLQAPPAPCAEGQHAPGVISFRLRTSHGRGV